MENFFEKTNTECFNTLLLDERLCMADSYSLMNSNFSKLSSSISVLMEHAKQFNNLYTTYSQSSAIWDLGSFNSTEKFQGYNQTYTTVQNASADWAKNFSVVYPKIFEINLWYGEVSFNTNNVLKWVRTNFPFREFPPNQLIYVYVNLYEEESYNFTFSGSYKEICKIVTPPKKVCCSGKTDKDCALVVPKAACNIHRYWNGPPRCVNPYNECSRKFENRCADGNCPVAGKKELSVSFTSGTFKDRYTARAILLKYQKDNNGNWRSVS